MRAAIVERFQEAPRYGEFREPEAGAGEVVVAVRAAALSNLVRGQASGRHYSSGAEMPFVPGNDGVGTLPNGQRVYFIGPVAPFGSMAERCLVSARRVLALPEGIDDVRAAALGNPGLASWGALLGRARLVAGETVLVNGATGVAGQQAVQAARRLGAKRVVATGRNQGGLERLRALGADEVISLELPVERQLEAFREALHGAQVDVVIDYLWGVSAETILKAAGGRGSMGGERRVRFVQVGAASGGSITLDGALLRSSGVELLGSGLGSLSANGIVDALRTMFDAAATEPLVIDAEAAPLSDVASRWDSMESGKRLVFTV